MAVVDHRCFNFFVHLPHIPAGLGRVLSNHKKRGPGAADLRAISFIHLPFLCFSALAYTTQGCQKESALFRFIANNLCWPVRIQLPAILHWRGSGALFGFGTGKG